MPHIGRLDEMADQDLTLAVEVKSIAGPARLQHPDRSVCSTGLGLVLHRLFELLASDVPSREETDP